MHLICVADEVHRTAEFSRRVYFFAALILAQRAF